eukprot:1935539-Rhodomonas_salina.1
MTRNGYPGYTGRPYRSTGYPGSRKIAMFRVLSLSCYAGTKRIPPGTIIESRPGSPYLGYRPWVPPVPAV